MTGNSAFLTIDAGGTFLKSAVLNSNGDVFEGSDFTIMSCSEESEGKVLSVFHKTITKGLKFINISGIELKGIGVAFPGPFDYVNGIPLMKHKFASIYGIRMKDYFRGLPGISTDLPISFIQDAHAVLSGELWKGNAQGFPNSAVVTLGTGLGFAYSKDGIVQSNSLGGPLISIFNMPYKDGMLEDYIARRGFLKIYKEVSGSSIEGIDVSDLGKLAGEAEKNSIRTFHEVGRILAIAIRKILIEKNINCLLLGGQISRSFQYLEKTLRKGLMDVECLSKISRVKSIKNAPLLGALKAINNNLIKM